MPGERRPIEEIRAEIAGERDGLEQALRDLRAALEAKRRPAAGVAGALAAGLAGLVTLKAARRIRGR